MEKSVHSSRPSTDNQSSEEKIWVGTLERIDKESIGLCCNLLVSNRWLHLSRNPSRWVTQRVKKERNVIARDAWRATFFYIFLEPPTLLEKMASYLRRFATSASTGKNLYFKLAFYVYSSTIAQRWYFVSRSNVFVSALKTYVLFLLTKRK